MDLNDKDNKFEITKFVENFLDLFTPYEVNKLNDCIKSMNKKQKKKSYKKFKKQKEKVYNEMSSLDLDEFLSNIKKDFLNIIDSKNEESISEFNKIQSLLSFESSNIVTETVTNKLINGDDQSEGEVN